jgi:hypothetical protein
MIFSGQNSSGVNPPTTGQVSKYRLFIKKGEICLLQWFVEAYDGMASMRTVNPAEGEIEITIAPGCEAEVFGLINHLEDEGTIHVQVTKPR